MLKAKVSLIQNLFLREFVSKFVYNKKQRCWQLRKKGYTISKLQWVPPTTGELFYLRMMLTVCRGPTSFEDIKAVAGVQYPTYREVCLAIGFFYKMIENSLTQSKKQKTGLNTLSKEAFCIITFDRHNEQI